MRAVVLRLDGPLQSYGAGSVGGSRPTLDAPTTSAVLGLVGAALGYLRHDTEALTALHRDYAVAVRIDRPGSLLVDYHTAEGVPTEGRSGTAETQITQRRYLSDASFAVALVAVRVAPGVAPEAIAAALRRPRFALSLGRRACVPGVPVVDRARAVIEGETWQDLLAQIPTAPPWERARPEAEAVAWVDARLAGDAQGDKVERVRDRLVGPLPRMFLDHERRRFTVPRPQVDRALWALLDPKAAARDEAHAVGVIQAAPETVPFTRDTTEEFFG